MIVGLDFVPKRAGAEKYALADGTIRIEAGSGFDENNPQHRQVPGTDMVRYGIAIQQRRDERDFAAADAMANYVRAMGFQVGTGRDFLVIESDYGFRESPSGLIAEQLRPGSVVFGLDMRTKKIGFFKIGPNQERSRIEAEQ